MYELTGRARVLLDALVADRVRRTSI